MRALNGFEFTIHVVGRGTGSVSFTRENSNLCKYLMNKPITPPYNGRNFPENGFGNQILAQREGMGRNICAFALRGNILIYVNVFR